MAVDLTKHPAPGEVPASRAEHIGETIGYTLVRGYAAAVTALSDPIRRFLDKELHWKLAYRSGSRLRILVVAASGKIVYRMRCTPRRILNGTPQLARLIKGKLWAKGGGKKNATRTATFVGVAVWMGVWANHAHTPAWKILAPAAGLWAVAAYTRGSDPQALRPTRFQQRRAERKERKATEHRQKAAREALINFVDQLVGTRGVHLSLIAQHLNNSPHSNTSWDARSVRQLLEPAGFPIRDDLCIDGTYRPGIHHTDWHAWRHPEEPPVEPPAQDGGEAPPAPLGAPLEEPPEIPQEDPPGDPREQPAEHPLPDPPPAPRHTPAHPLPQQPPATPSAAPAPPALTTPQPAPQAPRPDPSPTPLPSTPQEDTKPQVRADAAGAGLGTRGLDLVPDLAHGRTRQTTLRLVVDNTRSGHHPPQGTPSPPPEPRPATPSLTTLLAYTRTAIGDLHGAHLRDILLTAQQAGDCTGWKVTHLRAALESYGIQVERQISVRGVNLTGVRASVLPASAAQEEETP
ncbi:hypothetical protein ABZ502_17685 [Streptomyces abikoensis]|uniref:hypothetical protein n=1 Tax=Streptomyces abikoensis TaxID=97398 RepID=UPI0033FAAA09